LRQGAAAPCLDWRAGDEGNKPEVFVVAIHYWPALPTKIVYRKTLIPSAAFHPLCYNYTVLRAPFLHETLGASSGGYQQTRCRGSGGNDMSNLSMKDLFSVEGKVALVTGGSRGIGLMIARAYVQNGVKVYISSRKAEVCDKVAKELSEHGE